jgi:uncharacterized protein
MPTLERTGMAGVLTLSGFAGNGFRVGEARFPQGIILWPEVAEDWNPPSFDALSADDLALLERADPPLELLLLGTGAALRRPAKAFSEAMAARGIGTEPMDSRAAARTYNLLAGEGRRVAVALYPLDA